MSPMSRSLFVFAVLRSLVYNNRLLNQAVRVVICVSICLRTHARVNPLIELRGGRAPAALPFRFGRVARLRQRRQR